MTQEQTPTPETDALREEIWNHSYVDGSDFGHMLDHARKMERERDEAREQRDRLAEALDKVVDAWDHAEWLDENDFESFRAALQSLTPKP
jgi:hypothetical protein